MGWSNALRLRTLQKVAAMGEQAIHPIQTFHLICGHGVDFRRLAFQLKLQTFKAIFKLSSLGGALDKFGRVSLDVDPAAPLGLERFGGGEERCVTVGAGKPAALVWIEREPIGVDESSSPGKDGTRRDECRLDRVS